MTNTVGPVSLVLGLRISHERWGSMKSSKANKTEFNVTHHNPLRLPYPLDFDTTTLTVEFQLNLNWEGVRGLCYPGSYVVYPSNVTENKWNGI